MKRFINFNILIQKTYYSTKKSCKLIKLSPYMKVKDIGKILNKKPEQIAKELCQKTNHKYSMEFQKNRYVFNKLSDIVIPYDISSTYIRQKVNYPCNIHYINFEPSFLDNLNELYNDNKIKRKAVVAVMGHINHGKTSFLDKVKGTNLVEKEIEGITQKINIYETNIATFLDTPGHFHFYRMRTNAANIADLVILIISATEGILKQTKEAIGCIEEMNVPVLVCINKIDLIEKNKREIIINEIKKDVDSFIALNNCKIIEFSAKTLENFNYLMKTIQSKLNNLSLDAYITNDKNEIIPEGIVLEIYQKKGVGTILRILVKNGILKPNQHFVCGMIHGKIKKLINSDNQIMNEVYPGQVIDVIYSNQSKIMDAPIEDGFHVVLNKELATKIINQKSLEMFFHDSQIQNKNKEIGNELVSNNVDKVNEEDSFLLPIIIKANGAGTLTSIMDTVEQYKDIQIAHYGIGNINVNDVSIAGNGNCPIYGFQIKLQDREKILADEFGVTIQLFNTIHELIKEIENHRMKRNRNE